MPRRPAPPPQAPINEALRAHVTSAKFVLTLGATHIAALVGVERRLRDNRTLEEELASGQLLVRNPAQAHPLRRAFRHDATGMAGLIARGLVVHHHPHDGGHGDGWIRVKPSEYWQITPAGWAVITLLQQAGIWAEYSDALPAIPSSTSESAA